MLQDVIQTVNDLIKHATLDFNLSFLEDPYHKALYDLYKINIQFEDLCLRGCINNI